MDKTYYYLYQCFYKHFYKFCISGDKFSREAIVSMQKDVNDTGDTHIQELYKLIDYVTDMRSPQAKAKFLETAEQYQESLATDAYEDIWRLDDVLSLVYTHIYPDIEQTKKLGQQKADAEKKLDQAGITGYKVEFEDADYAIRTHIDKKMVIKDAYRVEFDKRDFRLQNRSFLTILKGYSSSTPFFYSALKERFHHIPIKGGGIFLKWKGFGVAIDPGINFMENMHGVGLNINDINAIIVTHNHIDHNGDLMTIDDLASQFDRQDIALYMDKKTSKEFEGRLVNFLEENRWDVDLRRDKEFHINEDITMQVIKTQHIPKGKDKNGDKRYETNASYAFKLVLQESGEVCARVGFTSDTAYLDELSELLCDCDYMIANLSETDEKDYLQKERKNTHLGYFGCLQLIKSCNANRNVATLQTICADKPRYIISEFWAGKGDVRKELIKSLRKESNYEYIYPGDIGMLFFLDRPTFLCGYCKSEKEIADLHIIKPGMEYAPFSNICNECVLL